MQRQHIATGASLWFEYKQKKLRMQRQKVVEPSAAAFAAFILIYLP
jgi:hypothetical protein